MNPVTQSKSNDDCYFYFYSTCTKGSECPFRHCESALGTESVCSMWREGRCFRNMCKFRHMENRKNRSMIPCYWENQPTGCRKPHCVFFHQKPRPNTAGHSVEKTERLIYPTASLPQSGTIPSDTSAESNQLTFDSAETPVAHPVQPVVVSIDAEESDAESTTSTPVKNLSGRCQSTNISVNKDDQDLNLGIKTLEQIRMEKIHQEFDLYANADAEQASSIPFQKEKEFDKSHELTYFVKDISPENTSENPFTLANKQSAITTDSISLDLRNHLKLRRTVTPVARKAVKSGSSSIKVTVQMESEEKEFLDFGIKTLAEIRYEKEMKKEKSEEDGISMFSENNSQLEHKNSEDGILVALKNSERKEEMLTKNQVVHRKKLKRKPLESYQVPALKEEVKSDFSNNEENIPSIKKFCRMESRIQFQEEQNNGKFIDISETKEKKEKLQDSTSNALIPPATNNISEMSCSVSSTIPTEKASNKQKVIRLQRNYLSQDLMNNPSAVQRVQPMASLPAKKDIVSESCELTEFCANNTLSNISESSINKVELVNSKKIESRISTSDELDGLFLNNDNDILYPEDEEKGEDELLLELEEIMNS